MRKLHIMLVSNTIKLLKSIRNLKKRIFDFFAYKVLYLYKLQTFIRICILFTYRNLILFSVFSVINFSKSTKNHII